MGKLASDLPRSARLLPYGSVPSKMYLPWASDLDFVITNFTTKTYGYRGNYGMMESQKNLIRLQNKVGIFLVLR